MGYFKIKSRKVLGELPEGTVIEESDYSTLTPDGVFVQMEYFEEDENAVAKYEVKPGIFSIANQRNTLVLLRTEFVNDRILETLVQTKDVTDKIDCFFRNLHVYKEEGIEIPKRGILLYGPPGGGKTTIINKVANEYAKDGKTAVVVWTTDKFESHTVKDFIKRFDYVGVEKLILIVEDIGGTEIEQARMRSDSSLLSLLDNKEKTFRTPVLILATTNYPENFMGNLTNRPERFDDKIKLSVPGSDARESLLKFFGKGREDEDAIKLIRSKKADGFTPAHIKEVIIRSRIYEKSMVQVINEMFKEIEIFTKNFSEAKSVGIGFND
jgi:transitional endoplasmic reticulum ATPase